LHIEGKTGYSHAFRESAAFQFFKKIDSMMREGSTQRAARQVCGQDEAPMKVSVTVGVAIARRGAP